MDVQINLGYPFSYHAGQKIEPFNFCGDIVLATDPGKTNMAMTVGTPFGTQLAILQFRAPGSAQDTSTYCQDFKYFLLQYFANCNIMIFGIEQAISKRGMEHHRSSMVLTEIRANLIDVAFSMTGKKPIEINNWSWKYAILPDGMRSQSEKGSARFLPQVYEKYGNADVTDSICMYRYLVDKHCRPSPIVPNRSEKALSEYKVVIAPRGLHANRRTRKFVYEPELSLEENCIFYVNRTWELGLAEVDADVLRFEDIYKYAKGFPRFGNRQEAEVVVVRS